MACTPPMPLATANTRCVHTGGPTAGAVHSNHHTHRIPYTHVHTCARNRAGACCCCCSRLAGSCCCCRAAKGVIGGLCGVVVYQAASASIQTQEDRVSVCVCRVSDCLPLLEALLLLHHVAVPLSIPHAKPTHIHSQKHALPPHSHPSPTNKTNSP